MIPVDLAAFAVQAAALACDARDHDLTTLHSRLRRFDPDRLAGLALTLALMVDIDRPMLPVDPGTHQPAPEQTGLYLRHCRHAPCGRLFLSTSGHRFYCTAPCRDAARRGQWRAAKARSRKAA